MEGIELKYSCLINQEEIDYIKENKLYFLGPCSRSKQCPLHKRVTSNNLSKVRTILNAKKHELIKT